MATEVEAFIRVLYEKGFRGTFRAASGFTEARPGQIVSLPEHLNDWLEKKAPGEDGRALYLSYQLYSAPHKSEIDCRFEIVCGSTGRINISRVKLTMEVGREVHVIRVENNHRAPGSQAVLGYFGHPKPWDDHIRGRFPRR